MSTPDPILAKEILSTLYQTSQSAVLNSTALPTVLDDLVKFEQEYPGGIHGYINKGLQLFSQKQESFQNETVKQTGTQNLKACALSPVDGIVSLRVPELLYRAPSLLQPSIELSDLEETSRALLAKTAFVIVAGGLGERLGYSGIKLSLPVETVTRQLSSLPQAAATSSSYFAETYLEHYVSFAIQVAGPHVPILMMTSSDNHDTTLRLVERVSSKLGLLRPIRCLMQSTVPCFSNSNGMLSVDEQGRLLRKPHGHGDIHRLLFMAPVSSSSSASSPLHENDPNRSTTTKSLLQELQQDLQIQYLVFLQDTNAAAVYTIPISLAISAKHQLDMNFTCVPRKPGEAIGLLCDVTLEDGRKRTQNIEYNEYAPLSKKLGGEGDVAELRADGSRGTHSPFPGSINTLILRLDTYVEAVRNTHGVVPEFINPKMVSGSGTEFRSPARIESLMQDVALMLHEPHHRVGGTVFEEGLYHPLKNSFEEGLSKYASSGVDAHTACTAEAAIYTTHRKRLLSVLASLGVNPSLCEEKKGFPQTSNIVTLPTSPPLPLPLYPIVVIDAAVQCGSSLDALMCHLKAWLPKLDAIEFGPHSALFVMQSKKSNSLNSVSVGQSTPVETKQKGDEGDSAVSRQTLRLSGAVVWDLSKPFAAGGCVTVSVQPFLAKVLTEEARHDAAMITEVDWMRRFVWTIGGPESESAGTSRL